jgi:hypothetical protein
MKNLFITALLVLSCQTANAQTPNKDWNLFTVPDEKGVTVGYIYQSYAIGTVYSTPVRKNPTALRLICSTKGGSAPIVAVYWDDSSGPGETLNINISIDGKSVGTDWRWRQEGNIVYRSLADSTDMIQKMRVGRIISFVWTDSRGNKKQSAYSINDFNRYLSDFNTSCRL